jgi:uncharacterized membrane protein
MPGKKFSVRDALLFSWRTVTGNLWLFIGITAVAAAVDVIPDILKAQLREGTAVLPLTLGLLYFAVSIIVSMGSMHIALQFCRGQKATFSDLFVPTVHFWKYLAVSLLYGLLVTAGLLLFVVPGIIWAIKYQFCFYVVVSEGAGPMAALRKSGELTQGMKWNLFVFDIVLGLVNLLGVLALGVGLFVTVPVTSVASASVYQKVSAGAEVPGATKATEDGPGV